MTSRFDAVFDRRSIPNRNKWNWYAEDVLAMWVADMDFQTPAPILEALRGALDHGILGYELASASLLEIVAERLARLYDWRISPEMIVPIPGVGVGIGIAAQLLCRPGEGVLVQPPVFHHFIDFPAERGLVRQDAPLRRVDRGQVVHYELDRAAFESAIHSGGVKTGMFLLCNPHNPVGQVYSAEDLAWMAEVCEARGVRLCSDDIHNELLLEGTSYTPLAALSPGTAERSITLFGPGKGFNMSGLLCAFAAIPDTALCERFDKELHEQTLNVNSLGLTAARAAYSGACDEWQAELRCYLTANRDFLVETIQNEMPELRTTAPEATTLAWIDCRRAIESGRISGSPFEFFLEKARVALSDGAPFGQGGSSFVRLNFACPRSVLAEGLERMHRALRR